MLWLVGHAVFPLKVGTAQFIQMGFLVAIVIVPGQDLQHGRHDRGPHDGSILTQGVHDLHGLPQRGVLRKTDLIIVSRADERIGDDLIIA